MREADFDIVCCRNGMPPVRTALSIKCKTTKTP